MSTIIPIALRVPSDQFSDNDDNKSDEKVDDAVLKHNQRLLEKRKRLNEELKKFEKENFECCSKIRKLLYQNKQNLKINIDNVDPDNTDNTDDDQSDIITTSPSLLIENKEFKIPKITSTMNDREKKDYLSLLIRYLALSNNYQRSEIKTLYAKQTSLHLQAQGLLLDEQREYINALSQPERVFDPMAAQNNTVVQQLLAKFSDPHKIASSYEEYVKKVKGININAPVKPPKLNSIVNTHIDEGKSTDNYTHSPHSNSIDTPIMNASPNSPNSTSHNRSNSNASNNGDNNPNDNDDKKPKKKSKFPWRRKRSSDKIKQINIKSITQASAPVYAHHQQHSSDDIGGYQSKNSIASDDGKSIISDTSSTGSRLSGKFHKKTKSASFEKPNNDFLNLQRTDAPSIASTKRNGAISGARLIRFDPNYKQLSSRRQRCDIASIIASLQNSHSIYTKIKSRLPAVLGADPYSVEQNYGFDIRYCNNKHYRFDSIENDKNTLKQFNIEQKEIKKNNMNNNNNNNNSNNTPVKPSYNGIKPGMLQDLMITNSSTPSSSVLNISNMLTSPIEGGGYNMLSPGGSGDGVGSLGSSSRNLHSIINQLNSSFPDISPGNNDNDNDNDIVSPDDDNMDNIDNPSLANNTSTVSTISMSASSRKWSDSKSHAISQILSSRNITTATSTVTKQQDVKRAGWITLNQFLHLATNFAAHGLRDAQVLVLTHKTFCKSLDLLCGLRKRFWMPLPPNITPSEMSSFKTTHVKKVRGKITAILRYWLNKHWEDDFESNYKLQKKMNKFISEIRHNKETNAVSIYLVDAFDKQKAATNSKKNKIEELKLLNEFKNPLNQQKKKVIKFFYDTKTLDILNFEADETAACITSINCSAFQLISQRECFEWIKHKEKAPNVSNMIKKWNSMGNWAQREILSEKRDFKQRLKCIKYFIQIIRILIKNGDFSGGYAINSALHSTPVHRLKIYFAELTHKEHKIIKSVRELFMVSGNYPNLRIKMKNFLSQPCVPHVGLFTRDLTMLAEQKSTRIIQNILFINHGKCKTLAKQIEDLKMYQNNINKFNLKYQKPLLDYVETQLDEKMKTETDLYKISVKVAPKVISNDK